MREVFLVGVGATSFGSSVRAGGVLAGEAARAALGDAGVRPKDVLGASFAVGEAPNGELSALFAAHAPNGRGGPWAGRGLQRAWQAVAAGTSDLVLCVGAGGGNTDGVVLRERADAARQYMARTGATTEHLARITVKNRAFGAANPRVVDREGVRLDDVLCSEVVAWPLRQLMVARPASGAAAIVLASREGLRRTSSYEVRLRASVLLAGPGSEVAATRAARLAYQAAGMGPEHVDLAELDDRTAAGELTAYEALQFVPAGQGPLLVDSGFTTAGGVLPVNTSGGLLSQGEAGSAAPLAQLCELTWQLRGDAGDRQVAGARTGLALSSSETTAEGPAFASVLILTTA